MLSRFAASIVIALSAGGCTEDHIAVSGVQFLEFYADWCAPCKMQKPIVDRLQKEFATIEFRHVNVDRERRLAQRYRIRSIPCMIILVNGQEKKRFVGLKGYETLSAALARYRITTPG